MGMKDDIRIAIDQNLTAEVGSRLKEELAELERLRKETTKLSDMLAASDERGLQLNETIESQAKIIQSHVSLDSREADLERRERELELTVLKVKLEAETRFGEKVTSALLGLVRNVEFRRNVSRSPLQGSDSSGGVVYGPSTWDSEQVEAQ